MLLCLVMGHLHDAVLVSMSLIDDEKVILLGFAELGWRPDENNG